MTERGRAWVLAALALALVLRAHPLWTIGFYQDDAVMSLWRQEAALAGKSVYEYCYDLFKAMLSSQGRFAPVGLMVILPLQMVIEDNLVAYRVVQAAAQLLALGAFGAFVRAASGSTMFALGCAAAFVGLFEVRNYHDSAFSYFMLYPFIVTLGFAACHFALRSSEREQRESWMSFWPVVILNAAGILTYEMALPFCMLACLILLLNGPHPARDRLLRAVVAGIPVLVVVAVGLYLKSVQSVYEGTTVGSLGAGALGSTYLRQLGAAVPLTYWMLDPHQLFGRLPSDMRIFPQGGLSMIAMFAAASIAVGIALWQSSVRRFWILATTGVILTFVPPALIAMSAKYQKETLAGVGYLQTVVSYLGIALLAMLACAWVVGRVREASPRLAAAVAAVPAMFLGAVAAVALLASYRVAEAINEVWRYPRELTEVWMRASPPPEGGRELIVLDRDWVHRWESRYFLRQVRGTDGDIVPRTGYRPEAADATPVTFLRQPDVVHPSDLALVLESSPQAGALRVRGYAISTSAAKLRHAQVALRRGERTWPLEPKLLRGRHGYWYRFAEVVVPGATPEELTLEGRW